MSELTVRPNNYSPEMALTMRDVVMPVFRQRRLVALTFLEIFLGAVLCAVLLPRKYEAEMKILVNRERVDAVVTPDPDNANGPGMVPAVSEEDLNSEVELIKSRDLLERVVLACGLAVEAKSRWQQWISRAENSVRGTPATSETQLAQAVQMLAERLVVDPMKKTTLIRVAYSARDPQLAAQVLQTLATMYQEKHASVHRPPGTFRFFDQETQRYRDDLATTEAALTDFDSRQGIVEVTAQKRLVLEQLSQFEAGWQQAQANAYQAKERAKALRAQAAATPERQITQVAKIGNAQLLATLEGTLLSLELKRTEMLSKYAPVYPPVLDVETQIADTRRTIAQAEGSPVQHFRALQFQAQQRAFQSR